ncbi:MAG TPA: hypothetical protein VJ483_02170 [Holophagaceae bacterium]|nr:hypothetical protein [Holophagaceae bacterium]
MELNRQFGAHRLDWVMDLGRSGVCAWHLMKREEDGARFVLQRFHPRPDDRGLELLREAFLGAIQDADATQPTPAHFGFDEEQIWFLQRLEGTPLPRAWAEWTQPQRREALRALEGGLAQLRQPRFLHPEAIGLRPGVFLLPRVLGEPPWGFEQLRNLLPEEAPATPANETPLWERPRELAAAAARPIRGRGQELTFLKSLMLGLSAPSPMERIILVQGEEGIGKNQLALWACAVAEGDGLWVHHLTPAEDEGAARLLERLLISALQGIEADLYAQRPQVARVLSRRLPAFSFLAGGRRRRDDDVPEMEEVQAALEALDFAASIHSRLFCLTDLDRAEGEALSLVRELALRSTVPWLLSVASGVKSSGLGALVAQIKADVSASLLNLNRLEDEDLRDVLRDLLGDHRLPEDAVDEVLRHSLGNPGLLQSLLELAQQDGSLRWERGRWALAPGRHLPFRAESDLAQQVFLGRLQRLHPATAALVRLLALADRSLPVPTLGAALGLAGDPLEDALESAVSSKLVQVQGTEAIVPDPRWRDLIRENTPRPESRRMAKTLLAALPEGALRTALSVPLQTLAADDATALAELMKALERDPVASPREAQRVVIQALALRPGPLERARLHEWLADAWAHGTGRGVLDDAAPEQHPASQALDALDQAMAALRSLPDNAERPPVEARLLRKKALLQLQARRLTEARQTLATAIDLLSAEPAHPERLRLRTVEGKLQLLDGRTSEGVQSLEEGLRLMAGGKYAVADQVAMHLELGRALGQQSQFHRALQHLQSAQRMLEMESDHRAQIPVQLALGQLALTQGSDACLPVLQQALQTARYEGDMALQAHTHMALGVARSVLEQMGPALAHLERAVDRLHRLGDGPQATLAQLWRARTLAALGDTLAAEHLQLKALSSPSSSKLTALEAGDQAFLQAEVAGYRAAWRDAARLYGEAALHFASADLSWRERLASLRTLQAEAREARQAGKEASEASWNRLEMLKALVDGSGSRWLDLEWLRAHALLLTTAPPSDAVDLQTLQTWGGALGLARQLQRPGLTLEACVEGAALLLRRGEKLGAMARLQDSTPAFQQLWSRVPETHEQPFLGREDIHRYRELMTMAGLRFVVPDRGDPLADWEPTQANLPPLDPVRTT